jgi:hypothetical protein
LLLAYKKIASGLNTSPEINGEELG